MIIQEKQTAQAAFQPFARSPAHIQQFVPFRDASYWPSEFDITVQDTLNGIYKATRWVTRSRPRTVQSVCI
jgi:hypothetical protein